MACYEALFGQTSCHIDVHTRTSVRGGAVFIATPYVLEANVLYWFPNEQGHAIQLPGVSESNALDTVARFLAARCGSQAGPFHQADQRDPPLLFKSIAAPDGADTGTAGYSLTHRQTAAAS